ncbi:MAG: diacylglycerol kinase [Gammaproteobacteria bacterium]|nr:MAG: diacylglycerol kinase [Gammaproteobacteria bacterium]
MKGQPFPRRLRFAWEGLRAAWARERSLRLQALAALGALLLLLLLRPAALWWALVGAMVALVVAAELFNTALEELADHLHPERHPRIKRVKDCAAAAVLVMALGAAWVGLVLLLASR